MKNNSLSSFLFMRFQPFWHIIHLKFTPFTGFTFLNQIPYSSVIQGEEPPRFTGNRAHRPYARCLHPVCTVLGKHLHRDRKAATALHPVSPVNKALKQKGEADGRGRKYTEETFL